MDTADTAPAEPALTLRPHQPEPEEPVPSVPLSGLRDDLLEGLGVTSSGLSVGAPEGEQKEKGAVDMGVEEENPGGEHDLSHEVPFDDKPSDSAPSASNHPAAPTLTITTLPATHPATSSPQPLHLRLMV